MRMVQLVQGRQDGNGGVDPSGGADVTHGANGFMRRGRGGPMIVIQRWRALFFFVAGEWNIRISGEVNGASLRTGRWNIRMSTGQASMRGEPPRGRASLQPYTDHCGKVEGTRTLTKVRPLSYW